MYYLGIDVGGTSVKGGVVSDGGKIVYKISEKVNKNALEPVDIVVRKLLSFCNDKSIQIKSAGIGVPCVFDKNSGVVSYGNNLDFGGINLYSHFYQKFGLNIQISNDAAAAALGESKFGAAKEFKNVVLITIGTGIGCGIIFNGRIIDSNSSAVGELSHTIINVGGRKCTCGKRGCVEAYCSMTALYKDMIRRMRLNKSSLLWKKIDFNNIDGRILFDLYGQDKTATQTIDSFISYLGVAILNVANLLRPDAILLGGGVSAQGKIIVKPLNEYLKENLFAKKYTDNIPVIVAKNGNDAGILGAAALVI